MSKIVGMTDEEVEQIARDWRRGDPICLLRALIRQIEAGDFTDQHGHKLTSNVHFIAAKEAISGR